MYWWAKNHCGYTCDIRDAHVFNSKEEIHEYIGNDNDKFQVWPKKYIDERVSHHVDIQKVSVMQSIVMGGK